MIRRRVSLVTPVFLLSLFALVLAIAPTLVQASGGSFIGNFHTISTIVSTVPKNGEVLPLKMVDNSTSPHQTHLGLVFGDEAVQTDLLIPE